jgi:CRP/FNR family transcriptional regulator, cyclic AMP receptor protein
VAELVDDPDPWVRACAVAAAGSLDAVAPDRARSLAGTDPHELIREAAPARSEGGSMETLSTLSTLERVMFLRKVPMFGDLPPEDLKQIADVATEHAYPDGEVIAEEGEGGDEMHIVVTGVIRVTTGRAGSETEIARREPGELVGEMAIIDDAPRMASLVCAGGVRTLSLHRRNFVRILRERPDVSLGVMRNLCERLRSTASA